MHKTGWERDRRTHFDEIVLEYDRVRPGYPAAMFEDVIAYVGPGKGKKAIEIGAGTGKATAPFLKAGFEVTAVEPGANMAAFLLEKFRGYKNFSVITSAFEDAPLDDGSYDLIYVGSAFHWVDAAIGCPKAFRLLKNGGTFALLRYNEPGSENALNEEIRAVYEKHYFTFYESKKWLPVLSREGYCSPAGIQRGYGFEDMRHYGFSGISMKTYDVPRTFGAEEYIALLATMADLRALPESNRAALFVGIKEAIQRHGGKYRMEYLFQLYMGRKNQRSSI